MRARAGGRRVGSVLSAAVWLALAGTLTAPGPRAGDDEPATPTAGTETVTVTGEAERTTGDPTAFATVLHAADYADRLTTLPDLLRDAVGVQVKSLGGEFATVSIRGSSAEQVIVYLDGVPLNRALGGAVNLADIPLVQLDSIEIYRGATPASLSMASIGGAILLHSRAPGPGTHGTATASFGSFGTAEVSGSYAHGGERGDWLAGIDGARSDGNFTFLDNNGTSFDPTDDVWTRRVNNGFRRGHALLRGGLQAGPARISLNADLLDRDQGVPGVDALPSASSSLAVRRAILSAGAEAPGLAGGSLLLRGSLQGTLYQEAFDGLEGDIGYGPRRTDHAMQSAGLEVGGTWVASRHQGVSFLGALRDESASLDDQVPPLPTDHAAAGRRVATVTLEDQIALAGGRLLLNPSVRHERYDSHFAPGTGSISSPADDTADAITTGKLGLLARLREGLALRANAGTFLRLPDFAELYGDQGSVVGNPALLPERGLNLDLGITAETTRPRGSLRQGRVEAVLFETRAEDLILYYPEGISTVRPRNVSQARIRGVELGGSFVAGRLNGALSVVRQWAVDTSDLYSSGVPLPGRPRDEISAGAGLACGRGRLAWDFTYVGANYVNTVIDADGLLPARYLHDVSYRLPLNPHLDATFAVHNLFDDHTVDVARFPLPGRSFEGRLQWTF